MVAEYEASGATRGDFARRYGISVAKLDYHRRRGGTGDEEKLLPVEWVMDPAARSGSVRVVLRNGRGIEMDWGFDEAKLARLVAVLERA